MIWTIFCFIGIAGNFSSYSLTDWLFIIPFILTPYLLIWFISLKMTKPKSYNGSKNESSTDANTQSSQYIENGNTISRVDGKTISDEEIPYLIQIGYEKALYAEKTSKNPKFHRTAREEELSFNFEMKYGNQVCALTNQFENLYRAASQTTDLSQKIALLNDAVVAFEKAKKFCYSKGKGGTIYFQDMWEFMHNSQSECFSYLDNINRSLNEAIMERDTIIPDILHTIDENDGILQKNIYKELQYISKSDIQHVIKKLESENRISRIKKSNSYELHIVK